ncbi:thiol:disulfide interchange protein DsbA/DsbL [Deferribacterales bacterium RsTz2092]|nr:thiol:disulfide interchange protein [Deferribacterales bacterium]
MRILSLILVSVLFAFNASAADFAEGVHYSVLKTPLKYDDGRKQQIFTEVYSVYCGFCFQYERSVIPKLKQSLPKNVIFEERHIRQLGQFGEEANDILSVLWDVPSYQRVKSAYFSAIFVDKKRFSRDEFINFGLKTASLTHKQFNERLDNPRTRATRARWDEAYPIAKEYGTPVFVVNGRYVVLTDSIKSQQEYNELIKYLLKK